MCNAATCTADSSAMRTISSLLTPRRPDRELAWLHRVIARLGSGPAPGEDAGARCATRPISSFSGTRIDGGCDDCTSMSPRRRSGAFATNCGGRHARRALSLAALVAELNPYIRGARQYFRRVRRRTLSKLDRFVEQRVARWWARKHARRRPAWSLVSREALCRQHGLERWNLPVGAPSSRLKARAVNVEGSRMREIRTYGLMRGCWPVRLARRAGVYSTEGVSTNGKRHSSAADVGLELR